jgi:hypothetical protein
MRRQTAAKESSGTGTIPAEVDLSLYQSLQIAFKNARGKEVLNIQFRHEAGGSPEFAINILNGSGEVASALTLFDLDV